MWSELFEHLLTRHTCRAATFRGGRRREHFIVTRAIAYLSSAALHIDRRRGRYGVDPAHSLASPDRHGYSERGVGGLRVHYRWMFTRSVTRLKCLWHNQPRGWFWGDFAFTDKVLGGETEMVTGSYKYTGISFSWLGRLSQWAAYGREEDAQV